MLCYCSSQNLKKGTAFKILIECLDVIMTTICFLGTECGVHCNYAEDRLPRPMIPDLSLGMDSGKYRIVYAITCSGGLEWHPPPEQIQCKEECLEDCIGDGACDYINNREMCRWDGGDCCSSTVEGGIVRYAGGMDCLRDCGCKDPRAAKLALQPARHPVTPVASLIKRKNQRRIFRKRHHTA